MKLSSYMRGRTKLLQEETGKIVLNFQGNEARIRRLNTDAVTFFSGIFISFVRFHDNCCGVPAFIFWLHFLACWLFFFKMTENNYCFLDFKSAES